MSWGNYTHDDDAVASELAQTRMSTEYMYGVDATSLNRRWQCQHMRTTVSQALMCESKAAYLGHDHDCMGKHRDGDGSKSGTAHVIASQTPAKRHRAIHGDGGLGLQARDRQAAICTSGHTANCLEDVWTDGDNN